MNYDYPQIMSSIASAESYEIIDIFGLSFVMYILYDDDYVKPNFNAEP